MSNDGRNRDGGDGAQIGDDFLDEAPDTVVTKAPKFKTDPAAEPQENKPFVPTARRPRVVETSRMPRKPKAPEPPPPSAKPAAKSPAPQKRSAPPVAPVDPPASGGKAIRFALIGGGLALALVGVFIVASQQKPAGDTPQVAVDLSPKKRASKSVSVQTAANTRTAAAVQKRVSGSGTLGDRPNPEDFKRAGYRPPSKPIRRTKKSPLPSKLDRASFPDESEIETFENRKYRGESAEAEPPAMYPTLTVRSDPMAAVVRADGAYLGVTPMTVNVAQDTESMKLEISKYGYLPIEVTATKDQENRMRVAVTLKPNKAELDKLKMMVREKDLPKDPPK